jgi:hypothetical protein
MEAEHSYFHPSKIAFPLELTGETFNLLRVQRADAGLNLSLLTCPSSGLNHLRSTCFYILLRRRGIPVRIPGNATWDASRILLRMQRIFQRKHGKVLQHLFRRYSSNGRLNNRLRRIRD